MDGEQLSAVNMAVELMRHQKEEPWQACRLVRRAVPHAKPGHVVVRVRCRSVNPSDISCIWGTYKKWRPLSFPVVLGFEGMGVVHQIGEGVSGFEVGQRVYSFTANEQGLWQDFIVVPAAGLVPIPPSVPDDVAAQFLVNPWSVVGMLDVLKVPKGDYLLQTAAASVLGRMLIQYARHLGIKTINVVRRAAQVEELKALGADEVIVSTQEDVVERVKLITGGNMAHSAVDCVGGETTQILVNCVRDGSTVLMYGVLGDPYAMVPIAEIIFNAIKIEGFYLMTWISCLPQPRVKEISTLVMGLLEEKVITPMVGEKFPLDKFQEAIKKSLEPGRGGKVLLVS